jgi:hypothetical protein
MYVIHYLLDQCICTVSEESEKQNALSLSIVPEHVRVHVTLELKDGYGGLKFQFTIDRSTRLCVFYEPTQI